MNKIIQQWKIPNGDRKFLLITAGYDDEPNHPFDLDDGFMQNLFLSEEHGDLTGYSYSREILPLNETKGKTLEEIFNLTCKHYNIDPKTAIFYPISFYGKPPYCHIALAKKSENFLNDITPVKGEISEFIYATHDEIRKFLDCKKRKAYNDEQIKNKFKAVLQTLESYVNGRVYAYKIAEIHCENNCVIEEEPFETDGNFYDYFNMLDDILPKPAKELTEYLIFDELPFTNISRNKD